MDRDIELLSYLPDFMQKYAEIQQIMRAENIEALKLENSTKQVKKNQFIDTCDESGIKRYENVLKIAADSNESLSDRKARVIFRWADALPYTYLKLIQIMQTLCKDVLKVVPDFNNYKIDFFVALPSAGQVDELEKTLKEIIPCNIEWSISNTINHSLDGTVYTAAGTVTRRTYTVHTLEV